MPITKPGYYRLKTPNRALESWAGAHYDLWIAEEFFEMCLQAKGRHREACWTAAVVKYFRAFDPAHWPAAELVFSKLSVEQLETHFYMSYLRNRMFTHRLGVGDNYEITGSVQPNGSGVLAIVYVGPMKPRRISGLGDKDAREFLELTRVVRQLCTQGFDAEKERLLHEYSRLPMNEVLRGQPLGKEDILPQRTDSDFIKFKDAGIVGLQKWINLGPGRLG